MTIGEYIPACEALLFVAGDEGISLEELCTLLDAQPDVITYTMMCFQLKLANDSQSGLAVKRFNRRYHLVTKADYYDVIKDYAVSPFAMKLSNAALETLAIIAYQSPTTRMAVDAIRGVQSGTMLKKLMSYQLVEEKGRQDSPGHPILYGVTDYFFDYFGLDSTDDLPPLETLLETNETENDETDLYHHESNAS
ncbi:MAG: SMC-Scp complex subunit ScpB [Aerococcus sp.]|nr:SMC-Scp complex subunit ScpB [Aerococcus sp.]